MPAIRCTPVPESPICAPAATGGTLVQSRGAHGTAHGLRDILIGLELRVRAFAAKPLDGGHDDSGIDLVDPLPPEAEPIQNTRPEVLHQHVAALHQPGKDLFALVVLQVHGDRALVAVQHREVEAVGVRDVPQLFARGVSHRRFELDDVRTQEGHQLARGRTRLNVGHVQNANVRKRLIHSLFFSHHLYMV